MLPARDEPFDDGHDVIGGAVAGHVHGERFAGELVDDVAQLQPPAIGGLVELEVDGPHLVGSLGPQQLTVGQATALAFAGRWSPQPFFSPQPAGALAIDDVTLPAQDRVRRLPAPPRVAAGDLP